MRLPTIWLATATLGAMGCGSPSAAPDAGPSCTSRGGPVEVVVQAYDYASQRYQDRKVTLTTPTDVCSMRGPVVEFREGARLVVDGNDPALQKARTAEEMAAAVLKDPGRPAQVGLTEVEGALRPADARSMEIVTAYYNFERVHSFFAAVGGVSPSEAGTLVAYYHPSFVINGVTMTDNVSYLALVQGVLLHPQENPGEVPFALNAGVIGQLYAAAVFNGRVHDRQRVPSIPSSWRSAIGASPGANLLGALEAGQADLVAVGVTCTDGFVECNPRFMEDSLPATLGAARRVDALHCMDASLKASLEQSDNAAFVAGCAPQGCHFALGTVFASAMWRAAHDADLVAAVGAGQARKLVFQALWNAQTSGTSTTTQGWRELVAAAEGDQAAFRLETRGGTQGVLDTVLNAAPPEVKAPLCSAFLDRFGLTPADLAGCPGGAASYGECTR